MIFKEIQQIQKCKQPKNMVSYHVSKLNGGDSGLDESPQPPEEVRRQGEPRVQTQTSSLNSLMVQRNSQPNNSVIDFSPGYMVFFV